MDDNHTEIEQKTEQEIDQQTLDSLEENNMRLTIDRFEDNNLVVLESSKNTDAENLEITHFVIPRSWLPEDCQEGDVLTVTSLATGLNEGTLTFAIDEEGRARAAQEISNLRASLNKAPDGDIDL